MVCASAHSAGRQLPRARSASARIARRSCGAPIPPRRSPASRHHATCHEGFTLVELLVVIAVIALLAGLVLTAIGRALRQSRTAQCASTHAQLGHGLRLYGISHSHFLPPFGYLLPGSNSPTRSPFWSEAISAFLCPTLGQGERLHKTVRCPAWSASGPQSVGGRGIACSFGEVFRYYSPTSHSDGPFSGPGSIQVIAVRRPAATMLLMDGRASYAYTVRWWPRVYDWDDDGLADTPRHTSWIYGGGAPFRHGDRCNVLYADGHVGAVRARQWLTDNDAWRPD
ncbi:MAG: prepilin-type N-terminal cleavage/methylation domain-containing protein [Candidatus Brocadiae bacterium]|nr:prepilin-type N-terminal cleavage/methylation domain-containing protein [Candidatus Brocadiia bacterium]